MGVKGSEKEVEGLNLSSGECDWDRNELGDLPRSCRTAIEELKCNRLGEVLY